ncbi:branched-chain amino acid ABC transporter permease [Clostridium sp. YIM B02515]|uniref:Branched-chain amino acid ABC transporter permease n=1 Tax=Clostridium rhizosphaerae TaxID=2803861 RepID=A0ABS1T832_9CLOT|nr:branched-chain amino acid ABC transporter permease [Clostridium rhizosphaerae]MBL4935499.1 branched-chain amino acid ABC transporter permease [Clostridium rhizosphaerae]
MKIKKSMLKNPHFQFILFGVLLAIIPSLAELGLIKTSHVTIIGGTLIYAIAALGLNVLLGYSGLITLGTAGFMGLSAYISAYVTINMKLPFEVALILAIAIPALLGLLVGLVSLKIEGIYLAIATLCVSEILRKTFEEFDVFTNGFSGKQAGFPVLLGFLKLNRTTTYYLIVFVLIIIMLLTYNLINGQLGRALNAMRGSEAASQAMGVNLLKYRLVAFAIATIYASVAGVLYVHFIRYAYPATWSLKLSLDFLAMIVIGGLRSIYGTVFGAFIVFAVPDLFLKQIPYVSQMSYVLNGVLIIVVILFYPNGAVGIGYDIKAWVEKFIKRGHRNESGKNVDPGSSIEG